MSQISRIKPSYGITFVILLFLGSILTAQVSLNWKMGKAHGDAISRPAKDQASALLLNALELAPTSQEVKRSYQMALGHEPKVFLSGDTHKKWIALTFDDSPFAEWTPKLLSVLKAEGVKATFFCVGSNVLKHPKLTLCIVDDGHELANHTYTHANLTHLDFRGALSEMLACSEAIRQVTGKQPTFIRPPGGAYNDTVLRASYKAGLTQAFWSVNSGDYRRNQPEDVVKTVLKQAKPGAVVVMHDGITSTLGALPSLIHRLRAQGYEFVTLSQMLAEKKGQDDSRRLSYKRLGLPVSPR